MRRDVRFLAVGWVLLAAPAVAGGFCLPVMLCQCTDREHSELIGRTSLSMNLAVHGCSFDSASGSAFSAASAAILFDTTQSSVLSFSGCCASSCDGGLQVAADSDGEAGNAFVSPVATFASVNLDGSCADVAAFPFASAEVRAGSIQLFTSAGLQLISDSLTFSCPCTTLDELGIALEGARASGGLTLGLTPNSGPCSAVVDIQVFASLSRTNLVCGGGGGRAVQHPRPLSTLAEPPLPLMPDTSKGNDLTVHFITLDVTEVDEDGGEQQHLVHGVMADGFRDDETVSVRLGALDDPALALTPVGDGGHQVSGTATVPLETSDRQARTIVLDARTDSFSRFGDLDGDDLVCTADRALLAALAAKKTAIGDAGYTARADFNLDGQVGAEDLSLFDSQGTQPECEACACLGDVDRNGLVDGDDVAGFVACMLGQETDQDACACADLNGDGVANGLDIQLFTDRMLQVGGACTELAQKDCDGDGTPDYIEFTLDSDVCAGPG